MSDITKKIFSIEQAEDVPLPKATVTDDIVRPASETVMKSNVNPASNVPKFVTREPVQQLSAPPQPLQDIEPSSAAGWVILGFGILYLIAAGLYFGSPLLESSSELSSIAGLALLLILPLVLLFLLWRGLIHLRNVSLQNSHLSQAAAILVSPDKEALGRTETLATGVRAQISKVNSSLSDTVEALKGVQIAVTRESQALDAAGLTLTNRSEDVGRNLTLQRQALESMSGTFDTRMSALSTEITNSGQALDEMCTSAETKLLNASTALGQATTNVSETIDAGTTSMSDNITALETMTQNLGETSTSVTDNLNASTETLTATRDTFAIKSKHLDDLNALTQSQISDLQATIRHGHEMLSELKASADARAVDIASYYEDLSHRIKQSEDDTLTAQGQTARMVQSNLAQMRRDFSRMETDLQSLQIKLKNLKENSEAVAESNPKPVRLNLMPLDSDFPPVEPPAAIATQSEDSFPETPLNLGVDMEIQSENEAILNYKPDVIRRPGEHVNRRKNKGFGRRKDDKNDKSNWRWRDMLGTLERPDTGETSTALTPPPAVNSFDAQDVDGVSLLTGLQLTPSAIVDEGTVVDATQARINNGEPGLTSVVAEKLPEAVAHLKQNLDIDPVLKADLRAFTLNFAKMIGNTPPTAPALRATLGSPEGRAYLLCAAAFKPELRA